MTQPLGTGIRAVFWSVALLTGLTGVAAYITYEHASKARLSRARRDTFDDLRAPEQAATA